MDVKDISIKDFLEKQGFVFRHAGGGKFFCSSPFSRDSNWSFCVYPTNTYFDWSTGHGGGVVSLYSRLFGVTYSDAYRNLKNENSYAKYKPNYKQYKQEPNFWKNFDYKKYVNTNEKEIARIQEYATNRRITEGYLPGVFFTRENEKWIRNPSLMFLHRDQNNSICGAKFRKITKEEPRFSARGALGFYILQTNPLVKPTQVYVVESESSANSLWMYLKNLGGGFAEKNIVILSKGGVSTAPDANELPKEFQNLPTKLIIDYDGNEVLYKERLKLYKNLNAIPVKIILPKGEDINSLYCQDKMYLIEHLLLK